MSKDKDNGYSESQHGKDYLKHGVIDEIDGHEYRHVRDRHNGMERIHPKEWEDQLPGAKMDYEEIGLGRVGHGPIRDRSVADGGEGMRSHAAAGGYNEARGPDKQGHTHDSVGPLTVDSSNPFWASHARMSIGYKMTNWDTLGLIMANNRMYKYRARNEAKTDEERELENAKRREARAGRTWQKRRDDTVDRKCNELLPQFQTDRDPAHYYLSDVERKHAEGIEERSAMQLAVRWRINLDEERLRALAINYAAFVDGVTSRTINQRIRRKPHLKDRALEYFHYDLITVGAQFDWVFDAGYLLEQQADLLTHWDKKLIKKGTRSLEERQRWIVRECEDFFSKGNLFPIWVTREAEEELMKVVELLLGSDIFEASA